MATKCRVPPTQGPSRVPGFTVGSLERSVLRILFRLLAESVSPAMSGTTFDRSRILPFWSMMPGFSRPGGVVETDDEETHCDCCTIRWADLDGMGTELSQPSDHHDRAVWRGWADRRPGAHRGAANVAGIGTAGHHRECHRRSRYDRGRPC